MAHWYLYLFSSRRKQKLVHIVIAKGKCEFRMCKFILVTESVSIKWKLSMFSKYRIIFPCHTCGHTTIPFQNLKPASKHLSLRSFAHTWCATLKGTSLLSDDVIMQCRNNLCSREETKEHLYFKGNLKNYHPASSIATLMWKLRKALSDFSFSTLNTTVKYGNIKTKLRILDGTFLTRNSL